MYSIIISTYNWPSALDIVLANLLDQLKEHNDVEIIIADDGSGQDTKEIINKYQKLLPDSLLHVWHEDNGFQKSKILNKAVVKARGDYLIFLDGDCIPFPDYISMHKRLMEPGFFVAGNRVLLNKKFTHDLLNDFNLVKQIFKWNLFNWVLAKLNKKVNKIFSAFIRLNLNSSWRYWRQQNWKYPKGCNFGIWKKDFFTVNGYDEIFAGWGHEDADLFIRLLHNNVKIKDGRFALPVLHLWHKNYDRQEESVNYNRLMERLANPSFVAAKIGLNNSTQNY